jgi:hypothetical protein
MRDDRTDEIRGISIHSSERCRSTRHGVSKKANRRHEGTKGQWKGKDTPRRAGHMAAPSATFRRRAAFTCVSSWTRLLFSCLTSFTCLDLAPRPPRHPISPIILTPYPSSLYSSIYLGHPCLNHDEHFLPRCRSWTTTAARCCDGGQGCVAIASEFGLGR